MPSPVTTSPLADQNVEEIEEDEDADDEAEDVFAAHRFSLLASAATSRTQAARQPSPIRNA